MRREVRRQELRQLQRSGNKEAQLNQAGLLQGVKKMLGLVRKGIQPQHVLRLLLEVLQNRDLQREKLLHLTGARKKLHQEMVVKEEEEATKF